MLGWNETALFSTFIGMALKSTAVLGVAWLAAFLLRGRSAAARHLVWTAAAAAVLALPFLSVSLPVLPVSTANALPHIPRLLSRRIRFILARLDLRDPRHGGRIGASR
jgi:hypothetical protein